MDFKTGTCTHSLDTHLMLNANAALIARLPTEAAVMAGR